MAEYQAPDGSIHDDMNGEALHLLPQGCVLLTPAQAAALRITVKTTSQLWADYQNNAKIELERTSVTVERINEAISLGNTTATTADVVAFYTWRRALRAVLSQTQPATIPTALPVPSPASARYPAGT